MPIEMPKGLPFSVDTWTPASLRKRHHFLTHAHKDHLAGIVAHSSRPVYATRLTKALVLGYFPQLDDSLFVEIEVGQSVVVDDPDGSFSVTAIDANHCPDNLRLPAGAGFLTLESEQSKRPSRLKDRQAKRETGRADQKGEWPTQQMKSPTERINRAADRGLRSTQFP